MVTDAVPRLPRRCRSEALRRIEAAASLPAADPVLVHGDLAGENVHRADDDTLVEVLDRDTVAAAVGAATLARARIWQPTFPIEQFVAPALTDELPVPSPRRSTAARSECENSRRSGRWHSKS